MSFTLCGIDERWENYFFDENTASKIHENSLADFSVRRKYDGRIIYSSAAKVGGKLGLTVRYCQSILRAVGSKEPCDITILRPDASKEPFEIIILRAVESIGPRDINRKLIDHKTVASELVLLAADAKKISLAVVASLKLTEPNSIQTSPMTVCGQLFNFNDNCHKLNQLAQRMIIKALLFGTEQEFQFFLAGQDKTSLHNSLPKEIRGIILHMSIELAASDIAKKVNEIAANKVEGIENNTSSMSSFSRLWDFFGTW